MSKAADVRYDIVWRDHAGSEHVVATVTHHFDRPTTFAALPFAADLPAAAVPASDGDTLTLRFTTIAGDAGAFYIPNGDGKYAGGAIPSLTLPP